MTGSKITTNSTGKMHTEVRGSYGFGEMRTASCPVLKLLEGLCFIVRVESRLNSSIPARWRSCLAAGKQNVIKAHAFRLCGYLTDGWRE
jgi:hypothetical protein